MSLDDLLNSPDVGRQEDSLRVCLAGRLLPKVKACVDAIAEIEAAVNRDPKVRAALDAYEDALSAKGEDEEASSPTKMGQSRTRLRKRYESLFDQTRDSWPGYAEKRAELEDLNARTEAATGVLGLRAGEEGEWLRFVAENPARSTPVAVKDAEGNESTRDQYHPDDFTLTGGRCNADVLRANLGKYVTTFNGEHVPDDKKGQLLAGLSGGDRRALCSIVVALHEGTSDYPKEVSDLLASLENSDS